MNDKQEEVKDFRCQNSDHVLEVVKQQEGGWHHYFAVVAFVVEQIVLEDVGEGVAATDDEPLETADGVCAAALYCHEGTD